MRWIVRTVAVLLGIVVAAVAALFLVPADRIAGIAAERFEAATGRTLTIAGDVRPKLWPALGVSTGAVTIGNADWSDRGPMLTAENLSVTVDWSALFGGDIRVTGVTIDQPSILLEARGDGGNWVIDQVGPAAGGGGGAPGRALSLDRAVITDGTVTFVAADGTETTVTGIDAELSLPDLAGAATANVSARLNGQEVSADATIEGVSTFLSDGAVPVALNATFGDGDLRFDGRAGLKPLAVQGSVNGTLGMMEGLFGALGQPRPQLPEGLGRNSVALEADVTFSENRLSLRNAVFLLDRNRIGASADIVLGGARPRVTAEIDAGDLVLPGDGGETAAAGTTQEASTGWSTEPIDAGGLSALDGQIAFAANSVSLGSARLGRTRLLTTIDNARLQTDIRELVAYDGRVDGSFVVNNRSGLSVRADLAGSAIAISRLFAELFDYDRLVALGDMRLSVLGSGASQSAILNSLDGEGSFSFGAGELLGFDLVGMLTHLDTKYIGAGSKTIFDSITGTFRIVDGVVINDDLSFLAPFVTATGRGEVGVGGQTLNYRLVPRLTTGDEKGLSVPLVITGTWDKPKFRLDLEALAKEKFGEDAKALKDSAKQAVKDKVNEKLGVTSEEQPTKDAVKDKLKEEAAKGLLNLLGKQSGG